MLLAAALLVGLGSAAGRSPGPVELRWETVAGCPDRAAIREVLDTMLIDDPSRVEAEVTGRLAMERGAYVLHLEVALAGQREVRELRANDCALLSRAGVLVVAVTLDALATVTAVDTRAVQASADDAGLVPPPVPAPPDERSTGEPRPSTRSRSTAASPVPASAPRPRQPSPSRAGGATLAAGAGVSGGLTPAITGGLEGELGWRRGPLRLALAGFHWFSRSTALQPGVGIEAALSGGSLRGCAAFERGRLEVPLCAGLDLAAMHGGGSGSAVQRRDVLDLWVGVAAGAGIAFWPTRRLGLEARAEGVLGARRPAMFLVIDGQAREAFRMEPVAVRLLAGPIVRLW